MSLSEIVLKVVDKFIMQLEVQLSDRNVAIELTSEARKYLAKKGYDKSMGARPLERLIQNEIKGELADSLLFGGLVSGGLVKVGLKNNKILIDCIFGAV